MNRIIIIIIIVIIIMNNDKVANTVSYLINAKYVIT
jgi:hypothetical protein